MGGKGSGNIGRRKFGSKFYDYEGGYKTKSEAEFSVKRLGDIGIKTRIVHEEYELPWYPHDMVMGYTLWYIPTYIRPSQSQKARREREKHQRW